MMKLVAKGLASGGCLFNNLHFPSEAFGQFHFPAMPA